MKIASLAPVLLFALFAGAAPAVHGQVPGQPAEAPVIEEAPAADAPDSPAAGGQAESETIEDAPPAESVIEGTVESADPVELWGGDLPDLPVIGAPMHGGVNYQPASTALARDVHWVSGMIHAIMALIVLFVLGLMAWVVFRFNARSNPTPSRFTHNTTVEVAWTLVPILILILIGSFSLPLLFRQVEVPDPDLTIKTTGNQWYWSYEYPDNELFFDSLMLQREELAEFGYADEHYLLATDTAMVVPVNAVVRLQVTASDVIHSWAMPSFAVKMDGIPGRLNETWFQAEAEGVYFGQCSELCGKDHSYMPITVKVVSQAEYERWLDWAIDEYGGVRGDAELALAE